MEKKYCVYIHTFPNGKKYVGCTSRNPQTRWANGKGYQLHAEMFEAIITFGWNNITHEIVCDGLSKQEAYDMESDLILKYKTTNAEYGYNLSQGLKDGVQFHSDAGKERIRNAMKTRIVSDESRRKMSESKKGTAFHTQKHTEETKALISQSRKGKTAKENHPMAKAVRCVETGIVYPYAKAAEEHTGVSRSHICQVCKGQRKTAGKLHWEYAAKEAN